jgi:hypothetical protein
MAKIANALKTHPDVQDVRTNVQTGSIVVHHADNDNSLEEFSAILQDLGIVLGSIADVEVPFSQGKSEIAADITSAVKDLNDRFGQTTNGVVDLRLLIPWYVLTWYAFDSFIKLHYTAEPQTQTKTE